MADSAKNAEAKRKFKTWLNPMFLKLILTASMKSDSDEGTKPSPISRAFFKSQNTSKAKAYVHHKLNLELDLLFFIPAGLVTALHTGILF